MGAEGERRGEVVFNTAMCGYQEILTDPSYKGQIVVMTSPHIGNYGVNPEDVESDRVWLEGFVAREFTRTPSHWRATETLEDYLRRHGVVGLQGIDTRALTRRLRIHGAINGVLSTRDRSGRELVEEAKRVPDMVGLNWVDAVTRKAPVHWKDLVTVPDAPRPKARVAVIDCGVKLNIVRSLVRAGCDVTVFPASTGPGAFEGFDGIFISNGPGDPAAVGTTIKTVRALIQAGRPVLGICLGHQIIGAALGAKVIKLKFGHHGANHPVLNVKTGRIEITSQNHGFSIEGRSAEAKGFEITHVNLNDGTVEGMRHRDRPVFAVQYHPEAAPGPHDAGYLFREFAAVMADGR